jgi:hypothetical protein
MSVRRAPLLRISKQFEFCTTVLVVLLPCFLLASEANISQILRLNFGVLVLASLLHLESWFACGLLWSG